MKPTQKQIELIRTIEKIVSSWKSTNDLGSPTNDLDIDEELNKLQDENTDTEFSDNFNAVQTIEDCLGTVLSEIRNYGREDKKT